MRILMIGPQASGKGTQAELVSEELDTPHISTGDMFRENIRSLTELGKLALSYTRKGDLVPDDVTNQIVAERIARPDCSGGFVLDGYPRNLPQARFLDSITKLDYAVEIRICDEEAVKRITGRRTCKKCGAVYSIFMEGMDLNNVCKKCGGQLVIRDDDREDAVRKRLAIYHTETEPVLGHYKNILVSINGEQPVQKVFADIMKKIR